MTNDYFGFTIADAANFMAAHMGDEIVVSSGCTSDPIDIVVFTPEEAYAMVQEAIEDGIAPIRLEAWVDPVNSGMHATLKIA